MSKQKDIQDKYLFLGKLVVRMLIAEAILEDRTKSYSRAVIDIHSKWNKHASKVLYAKIAVDYKNEGFEVVKQRVQTGVYLIEV